MTYEKPKTLVLLDHPDISQSRVNRALAAALEGAPDLAVRDLRRLYPDGRIDVAAERASVEAVENIVLQYPTHWYAPPAFLKTWLDEVLVRGWAYGTGGPGALAGKTLRVATSTGVTRRHTLRTASMDGTTVTSSFPWRRLPAGWACSGSARSSCTGYAT